MINYKMWLEFVKNGIANGDERYKIIDDGEIFDVSSGIKLHIYDEWFKITHNDEVVATMRDFNVNTEQPIMWEIRQLITDPEKVKDEKKNHMKYIEERREMLSGLLLNPTAISEIAQGEEEYTG